MYLRGHAYFDNFFHQFSASLFPLYEEEKHEKTVTTITSTPKDRLPGIFKMYAQFFICSLHHLIQALWACWRQTDENLTDVTIHKYS